MEDVDKSKLVTVAWLKVCSPVDLGISPLSIPSSFALDLWASLSQLIQCPIDLSSLLRLLIQLLDDYVSKDKEVLLSVDMALEPKSILRPRVKVPKDQIKEACRPWKKAIVVKLLRKKLSMRFLRVRLPKLWQPLGEMEMIDLESDYFLIRFYVLSDLCFMFEGGP
ncbi:hypothetical protein JHK86_021473 [Glycine max]|nr:hypothetical protein JHK86_021473 [Glycine max]